MAGVWQSLSGLVANSILFCLLFAITDHCTKLYFPQTRYQGLCELFFIVSWDFCAKLDIPDSDLLAMTFGKQFPRWGWGSLKGAVSDQKALQGFKTETRELLGGTEENNILLQEVLIDLPSKQFH